MVDKPPRFITPEGFARIRTEYDELFGSERPSSSRRSLGQPPTATARKTAIISTAASGFASLTAACLTSPRS